MKTYQSDIHAFVEGIEGAGGEISYLHLPPAPYTPLQMTDDNGRH